ncbi:PGF-CTERM sorting domain-containing protein [Haloarcula sp. 1CSR25-25]|uniref:PGF-CTERM sorting domain-containing protein n=1 Tax=Haloarcula sp. 1CSR25-25 TaxID=2862545 RepID=UPI00289D09D5|nr:PGF-CTERM sorting domain-containing protein [Haloarcula sp. 1CSR25-25]
MSAGATPVDEGQTTAVTENVDVWERSLLPLRTTSTGPTTIAAPQTFINIESASTGDVPLNREQYTIHEAGEPVDLTFESTVGAGTSIVAGDEAQLLAVKLSEVPSASGFSDGSVRTELASIFTNDSSAQSVELLDDSDGVGSIDDNGVLETSYTPDSGGAYGFILVTVDDGEGLSVEDDSVSTDGNVTVVGVEQTLVQDGASTVEATGDDLAAGDNLTLDIETDLGDDAVTHAVLVFDEDELQQRASTVRVSGDLDEGLSEDQVTVENSFDGVSGVSTTGSDASLTEDGSTAGAMPSGGLIGLFGFVLSEASPESTGDDVIHASATTVSASPDTTVSVETLDSWQNGTYTYVHIAVGEDSNEIYSDSGTVTLSQSSGTDSEDNSSGTGSGTDSDDGSSDTDDTTESTDSDDSDDGGSDDGSDSDTSDGGSDETATDEDTVEADTEDDATAETDDETDADDGSEADGTEDEPTEAATTAGGGAEQPDDGTPTGTTSSSGPGFTVLVTVLALLGVGFLARRN